MSCTIIPGCLGGIAENYLPGWHLKDIYQQSLCTNPATISKSLRSHRQWVYWLGRNNLSMIISDKRIRFVSCSATLANPSEYMSKMFGLELNDMEVVSNDGSPSGSKEYLIWNPPLVDSKKPSLGRKSSLTEASNLMRFLMKKGIRVILFCKVERTGVFFKKNHLLTTEERFERSANW